MLTLTQDLDLHEGALLITYWGDSLAIGFRGPPDFIQRCYNWSVNTGMAKGELLWPFDRTGNLAYVLVESKEEVERAVAEQFRMEIIAGHEIPWKTPCHFDEDTDDLIEGDVDDEGVTKLAAQRAAAFMANFIKSESFLAKLPTSLAPTYEVSNDRHSIRAEESDGS